jgi:lysyl-tRNA synthetase class 2
LGGSGAPAGGAAGGNEIVRRRQEKLLALRAAGVDPFGTRFAVSHWAGPLHERWDAAPDEELRAAAPVSVAGQIGRASGRERGARQDCVEEGGR